MDKASAGINMQRLGFASYIDFIVTSESSSVIS